MLEIAFPVTDPTGVVPEIQRHGRKGLGENKFPDFTDHGLSGIVPGLHIHSEASCLDLACIDGKHGAAPTKAEAISVPPLWDVNHRSFFTLS